MDWSMVTAALIPGLDGVVLGQLYRVQTPQSAADVHRRAGAGSLNGVRYALDRLADQGLVEVSKVGNTYGYLLNRDHVVYPAVAAALDALDPWGELTRRLSELVDEHLAAGPSTARVSLALYGSTARREAGTGSDIDLLLVAPDDEPVVAAWLDGLTDALHQKVPRWTGNDAHVYRVTAAALVDAARDRDPLVASWTQDAVTVAGPDVRQLIAEAG
jgi:predicted nucleotidyltransferase